MIDIAKEWAVSFYKSAAWKKCREGYISSVHGVCERCLDNNKIVPGSIVHHKEYITPSNINNPNITLSFENLELLCQDCHNKEHHGSDYEPTREGLTFDDEGNLIPMPPISS